MTYPHPPVVVEWVDAVCHSDGDSAPRHEPVTLTAIGWLLKHDETGISMANEYGPGENEWRQEHFIPAGMIKSVTELEVE